MDWIAENLRRQRKVWHALLAASAKEGSAPEKVAEPAARSPASAPEAVLPKAAESRGAASASRSARQTAERAGSAAAERTSDSAVSSAAERTSDRAPSSAARQAMHAALARHSALRRRQFAAADTAKTGAAADTEKTAAAQAISPAVFRAPQLRARELSRTVERDARRYEGTFSTP